MTIIDDTQRRLAKVVDMAEKLDVMPRKSGPWLGEFELSDEEIEGLGSAEWIVPNLIVEGHLLVIAAEPNAGKTTIMRHLCTGMAAEGCKVYYVNCDVAATNAAEFARQARSEGWAAILPDFKAGGSSGDIVAKLHKRNASGENLAGEVLILDTFKKFTEVISKAKVREFMLLLRGLTAKGMTVVCLAHTNKYNGPDGLPVFEGTNDIRADCDELVYLLPAKNPDGTLLVSTLPNKVRAPLEPMTFEIDRDRRVRVLNEVVDTADLRERERRFIEDEPLIAILDEILSEGVLTQSEVVQRAKGSMGRPSVTRVLRAYSGQSAGRYQQWEVERAFQDRNTLRYWRKA